MNVEINENSRCLRRYDLVYISYEDYEESPILSDLPIESYHPHLRSMSRASNEILFELDIEFPESNRENVRF